MQQRSDGRQIAGQKTMTQKHFLTSIIDETLHALRDLAEKGSRGFDCSEHSLSVLNSWKRTTDGRRQTTDDGYQPPADLQRFLKRPNRRIGCLLRANPQSCPLQLPQTPLNPLSNGHGRLPAVQAVNDPNPHCFWRGQPLCKPHVCGRSAGV